MIAEKRKLFFSFYKQAGFARDSHIGRCTGKQTYLCVLRV